jgi:hypothetical protein
VIEENVITNIGAEYFGVAGIAGYNFNRTVIRNNTIDHVPGPGLAFGLGFGQTDAKAEGGLGQLRSNDSRYYFQTQPTFEDNLIEANLIRNYQYLFRDAGGIYTNGYMGRTRVERNVVIFGGGIPAQSYGVFHGARGLYLDEASAYLRFTENVVHGALEAITCNAGAPAVPRYNVVTRNYADNNNLFGDACRQKGPNPQLEPPILIDAQNQAAVERITSAAGAKSRSGGS